MRNIIHCIGWIVLAALITPSACKQNSLENKEHLSPRQILGKLLFHDRNLSTPPGQACVDCHSPEAGFANQESFRPVSQGVHKERFGNRNDLPAAYAGFSPEFHYDAEENSYV
ncbi:cytochrome-c peroxidase, partial [candidate division KSB1 bacterium]